jgi:DNA (cytosine-5)-methyltransferase 1
LRGENEMTAVITEMPSKQISDRMRKVRCKDTLIERKMERLLKQIYLSYETQPKMIGHPDFKLKDQKIAIFCDSSFWHGHPSKKQQFKRNRAFWEHKIEENRKRDAKNNRILRKLGWKVLRFWDDDILKRPIMVARKLLRTADPPPARRLVAVELFCGAGGLAHGFYLEGIKVVKGFDLDTSCKYAYEKNNSAKFVEKNVGSLDGNEVKRLYPADSIKILAGCAPCQPFSPYAHTKKKETDKWNLLYKFSKIIDQVQPDIVTMENVPTLISFKEGKIFSDFVENLRRQNYHVWYDVVNCLKYGVPQNRRRLVLLASRLGEIALVPYTHSSQEYLSVEDAIGDLEPIDAGTSSKKDPLHRARNLESKNMLRIKATIEGGNWHSWPEDLLLDCHKKKSGTSFRSVYGRMSWKEYSPTITTEFIGLGNGRFGHPVQDRAISLREAALLQTFPYYYDFIDPDAVFSMKRIAIHIGNAVPVRLGQIIAKSIKQHIEAVNLAER